MCGRSAGPGSTRREAVAAGGSARGCREPECGDAWLRLLAQQDALECGDAAGVEGNADLISEQRERGLLAPGSSVDTRRHKRVVHIADGEDPRVETQLAFAKRSRIALPVQPFVMAVHEL